MRRSLALAMAVVALAPDAAAASASALPSVSSVQATAIASRVALVRREQRSHPNSFS